MGRHVVHIVKQLRRLYGTESQNLLDKFLNKFLEIFFRVSGFFGIPMSKNVYTTAPKQTASQKAAHAESFRRQQAFNQDVYNMSKRPANRFVNPDSAGFILPDWKYKQINAAKEKKIRNEEIQEKMRKGAPKVAVERWKVNHPLTGKLMYEDEIAAYDAAAEAELEIEYAQRRLALAELKQRALEEQAKKDRKREKKARVAKAKADIAKPNIYQKMAHQQQWAKRAAIIKNINGPAPKFKQQPIVLSSNKFKKPVLTRVIPPKVYSREVRDNAFIDMMIDRL